MLLFSALLLADLGEIATVEPQPKPERLPSEPQGHWPIAGRG